MSTKILDELLCIKYMGLEVIHLRDKKMKMLIISAISTTQKTKLPSID